MTDGVSGVLAPYAVSNDNVIAAMLLGCFCDGDGGVFLYREIS